MPAVRRKLKGYVGGGEVGRDTYGTISTFADDPKLDQGGYPMPRYIRKSGPGMQRTYDPSDEPEQKRKGGMVMKKPVKGYQHGGPVRDTAPGAASASSRPWSANIKGRDVTMRAKGGKINNLKKGKR